MTSVRGRLRHAFSVAGRGGGARLSGELPAGTPRGPEIDVTVYAADCRLVGRIELLADRLTDALNAQAEFVLRDVCVESLADGHALVFAELTVAQDEILAVTAGGPRGQAARRRRVCAHPIAMELGPYTVQGQVHTVPGADPLARFRQPRALVPVTGATIAYDTPAGPQRIQSETLLVRADGITWVALARGERIELPELRLASDLSGLAKDLTGQIDGR